MTKRNMARSIDVPTLVDNEGHRHIIPGKGSPALCGVTIGVQQNPRDHRVDTLCLRCRQQYAKAIVEPRLQAFGLGEKP